MWRDDGIKKLANFKTSTLFYFLFTQRVFMVRLCCNLYLNAGGCNLTASSYLQKVWQNEVRSKIKEGSSV